MLIEKKISFELYKQISLLHGFKVKQGQYIILMQWQFAFAAMIKVKLVQLPEPNRSKLVSTTDIWIDAADAAFPIPNFIIQGFS